MSSNDLQDGPGIYFKTPVFNFGNTTPDINSGFSFDLPLAVVQSFANNAMNFSANNASRNQGFVQNVVNSTQNQVTASYKESTGIQSQSLNTLQDFASKLSDILSPSSGCFITTAICKTMGQDDDCYILNTFRKFRDNVMLKNDRWRPLVEDYYRLAPAIVARIDKRKDALNIYLTLRDRYLMPALSLIERKDNWQAIQLYREMVITAAAMSEA